MRMLPTCVTSLAIACVIAAAATAKTNGSAPDLTVLAQRAISADAEEAGVAVASLRAAGPAGLEALLATHADLVAIGGDSELDAAPPEVGRLAAAADAVAAQRDALHAGLYWHTDRDAAVAAARSSGRPILSLRLLGNLDDELSCANSRFFRTVLYPDATVGDYLREHFVLHWESVRPVPRITIDFGDGRRIERTITGNSVHYLLDSEGRAVDALPGLYGPGAFLRGLEAARPVAVASGGTADEGQRASLLARYHTQRLRAVTAAWARDLERVGVELPAAAPRPVNGAAPPAAEAAMVVASKTNAEMPMLRALTPAQVVAAERGSDERVWEAIAALHADDARLAPAGRAMMRRKAPDAMRAAQVTRSKSFVEDPMLRMVRAFERSIALDTVRNEYLLHRQVHEWLATDAAGVAGAGLDALNERVYAELFLTPGSDPWLGLAPEDAYTALDGAGLVAGERVAAEGGIRSMRQPEPMAERP